MPKHCGPLLLGNPLSQSKYSTYYIPNNIIKIDAQEEKNVILSDSTADIFSRGCQHEQKGLVEKSKVRLYLDIYFDTNYY